MKFDYNTNWAELLEKTEDELADATAILNNFEDMSDEEFEGHESEYDDIDLKVRDLEDKVETLEYLVNIQREFTEVQEEYDYLIRLYSENDKKEGEV